MIVLGIDTATAATAVALRLDERSTLEARDDPTAGAHPGHATTLLTMVDELLERASLRFEHVQRIAVGAGPGTFTGLRVGIATARGLARSLGAELVAVSSLHALAHGALTSSPAPDGAARAVLATIDARRGEVFAALYSANVAELAGARALAPGEIGEILFDGVRAVAVGDGAVRYRAELEAAGLDVPPDHSPEHLLRAGAVCELGLQARVVGYADVLPDYMRRPDAELALSAATRGAQQ